MQTDQLFTGQREMAGLGIYHYGSRFYSPKLGRFLSADTMVPNAFNPQDFNRYSYVRNNPVRYIDSSGHVCTDPEDPAPTCYGSGTTRVGNTMISGNHAELGAARNLNLPCTRNCGDDDDGSDDSASVSNTPTPTITSTPTTTIPTYISTPTITPTPTVTPTSTSTSTPINTVTPSATVIPSATTTPSPTFDPWYATLGPWYTTYEPGETPGPYAVRECEISDTCIPNIGGNIWNDYETFRLNNNLQPFPGVGGRPGTIY